MSSDDEVKQAWQEYAEAKQAWLDDPTPDAYQRKMDAENALIVMGESLSSGPISSSGGDDLLWQMTMAKLF